MAPRHERPNEVPRRMCGARGLRKWGQTPFPKRSLTPFPPVAGQRGAAIVSVILVVALVSMIVASLFVREHVAIRSVANRQDLAQSRWIERMAIDWGRFVLQADLRLGAVDHAGEL